MTTHEPDPDPAATAPASAPEPGATAPASAADPLVTYPFVLRPGVLVYLKLPRLTAADVDRITAFLRALVPSDART